MENTSRGIPFAVAIGAGIGAAMGSATHHMGGWLALGVGIGLAIGVAIRDRRNCMQPNNKSQQPIAKS